MNRTHVSIGTVKRDISSLVNRVAYAGERIVLTSRNKPKAAIVSMADYERLIQAESNRKMALWKAWQAESDKLAAEILAEGNGKTFDVEGAWREARAELEGRHDFLFDNH